MKRARLDECISSKRVRNACVAARGIRLDRFPASWHGKAKKDPTVLSQLLTPEMALITTDDSMATDHAIHVPIKHAGLVVVTQDDDAVATMTHDIAMSIMHDFKDDFPGWSNVPWDNSIIRITRKWIRVFTLKDGVPLSDEWIERKDDWQDRLVAALNRNAVIATP